jgi:hypothetical protein
MSSLFLPENAEQAQADLVPLMVHPEDRDRLQALSGIWPVADTLTRMINVFIASGSAQTAASVQSVPSVQPTTVMQGDDPAQSEVSEVDVDFAKNLTTDAQPDAARIVKLKGDAKNTTGRPTPKPTINTPAKTASRPGPKSDQPLLAFTREDYPDLKFTRLTGYTIGEVTRQDDGLNWSARFEEAVTQAIAAGYGPSDLDRIGIRMREGKHSEKGFRWCEKLNRSVQVSTSNYMFTRVLRIADLISVPVRVGVSWDRNAAAAHPGQGGLISAKPIRRPARPALITAPSVSAGSSPDEPRFPTVGSMVSYVYLDRPDDEKLSLLVDGAASPEAGEVSARSPLGVALIETPTGSVATIDVKGVNRKIKVIEVAYG